MKTLLIIMSMLLVACSDYPNVTRVCVNYLHTEAMCGTGFFIDYNKLVTAKHIIDASRNNVLTLVGPGPNETTHDFRFFGDDIDVMIANTNDIAESYLKVCDTVKKNTKVEMVARRGRFKDLEIIQGTVIDIQPEWLWIDQSVEPGFSGGPVIDPVARCALGSIRGHKKGRTVAVNLTTVLDI